jgi:PD-(D/E)XK endonuclease
MNGEHPVAVGTRTEARVLAALLERYDTIFASVRRQLSLRHGRRNARRFEAHPVQDWALQVRVIAFKTASSTRHHKNGSRRPYYGEADFFGVYCPELKTTYLVPVDACGAQNAYLRVDISKNGQAKGVRLAADYLLTG